MRWLSVSPPQRRPAGMMRVRGLARSREAVVLRLRDDDGIQGLGEAVPLPGYSRWDAAALACALARWQSGLPAGRWQVPDPAAGPAAWWAALAGLDEALPDATGAVFVLECALLDWMSRRAGLPAAVWLAAGRPLQPVPVSQLLPDAPVPELIAAALAAAQTGCRVLKLKVGRVDQAAAQELETLMQLRAALDAQGASDVRLRLDANGAWTLAQARARLAALQPLGLECVEEPVRAAELAPMGDALGLPVPWAADESLADPARLPGLLALAPPWRPGAVVLKPAELGFRRCLQLAQQAADAGLGLIVTHSLDADAGHAAACALAAVLPRPPLACGLGPHPGLRQPQALQPWLPVPTAPGLGPGGDVDAADPAAVATVGPADAAGPSSA